MDFLYIVTSTPLSIVTFYVMQLHSRRCVQPLRKRMYTSDERKIRVASSCSPRRPLATDYHRASVCGFARGTWSHCNSFGLSLSPTTALCVTSLSGGNANKDDIKPRGKALQIAAQTLPGRIAKQCYPASPSSRVRFQVFTRNRNPLETSLSLFLSLSCRILSYRVTVYSRLRVRR